jgi:VanZ family protein
MAALGLIFLITILLIVYGSLYPFDFHAGRVAAGPVWVLLHAWPTTLNRSEIRDIAINILIYLPIGLFGVLYLGKGKPRPATSLLTILLALALSVSMELIQFFDDTREVSLVDVMTNVAGATLGVFLAYLYGRSLVRIMARPGMRAAFHPSGAMLLLFSWIAYQIYPVFPQVSLYVVHAKLVALGDNLVLPVVPAIGAAVDWLAVAQLLEVVAGPKS